MPAIAIVERCAERTGGISNLAALLGIKHPALYQWTRVPAERVAEVERITGIPRHELRPDLYPVEREKRK